MFPKISDGEMRFLAFLFYVGLAVAVVAAIAAAGTLGALIYIGLQAATAS
jgi:ABC-type proline/glycine betaine transport system permease subunit